MTTRRRLLFIGDSITDGGRDRSLSGDLGSGYVATIAHRLRADGHRDLEVLNRGVSGDCAVDLEARWDEDCLDLGPDLLSIHVGVNDTWRRYDSAVETSTEQFETTVRSLLTAVRDRLGIPVVLVEPFVVQVPPVEPEWRVDLDPKIAVIRNLGTEFGVRVLRADEIFSDAATRQPAQTLASDGVHPTDAGHDLLASAWMALASDLVSVRD